LTVNKPNSPKKLKVNCSFPDRNQEKTLFKKKNHSLLKAAPCWPWSKQHQHQIFIFPFFATATEDCGSTSTNFFPTVQSVIFGERGGSCSGTSQQMDG
jgi:hypothetical protein